MWGTDESNVFSAGRDTSLHGVVRRFDGNTWEPIYDDSTTAVSSLAGIGAEDLLIRVYELDTKAASLLRYDGREWRDVTPTQVSRFGSIAGSAEFGYAVTGHNLDGPIVVDQSLLRLTGGRWELLNPTYSQSFRVIWGGLDRGVYIVGGSGSEILRCVLK